MSTEESAVEGGEVVKKQVRVTLTMYREDVKNMDKLVALRKYGVTRSSVVRTALIYLLEKEGGK